MPSQPPSKPSPTCLTRVVRIFDIIRVVYVFQRSVQLFSHCLISIMTRAWTKKDIRT